MKNISPKMSTTKKPESQTSASISKLSMGGKTKSEKLETITKKSSQPRIAKSNTQPVSGGKLRSEKSVNLAKKYSSVKEFVPRLSSSERRRVSYSISTNINPSIGTIGTQKSQMDSLRDIHSLSELYTNSVSSQTSYNDSLNNRGCDNAVVTEIDWSEIDEQFNEDQIFDYSDFYFKLDEILDPVKYENRPALNIRKLKDFELNQDERDGILSFRMISTGLSCLDVIPRLHKYVFTRLILRKLNLKNIVTVTRHRYLRHINLSYNCLEDVSCLSACPFLIHLDVSHNNLTELLNFSPPYYLTTVIYDNNRITHMPDLSEFWSIVNLSIEHNFIEKMDGLSQLRFLKSLNLSGNNIERIEGITNLYIEDLNLSYNQISGFETDVDDKKYGFKTMPCLTYVNLSNNNLETLKLFEDSGTLRIVNVSYNEVDDLLELGHFTYDVGLISLNMTENPICKFPGYRQLCIQHVLNIKYLDGVIVDDKEKVTANCIFSPNLWLCSLNKHAVFNFFKYFNMPTINLSTVPYDRPSTPIIMLVGPEAMKNDLAYEFCKKYPKHTYFIQLYTTRPPVVDREKIYATYHHVNRQTFNSMITNGEFISVHQFLGHSYGFSHSELVKAIEAKCVAIVTSDITGAFQLRMSGLNPTLIKITSQDPENYRRWLQSVFDTYFWDVLSPKDSAIIIARKNLQLTPDSDHIVRQSRDIYYDFATNIIELENKEICCECTCDCVKFFRHVEDWEKFIANLHGEWSADRHQSVGNFNPSEVEEGKLSYERSSTPSAKVTSDIIDYLHRITEKKAKMYDELHRSNPGIFADSIYTDHKIEAFEKLKDYVKKKFMEYKENCKEPHIEIPKDDAYMNMINRRINQVLEDLNDSENTALAQRKQAFEADIHESTVPDQLDPIFEDIVQRYTSMPRIQVDNLPEIPIHLNETLHHLLFDE